MPDRRPFSLHLFRTYPDKSLDEFPKVTVITICLNAERKLEDTLRSVTSQTYPNIEYLVIDGASSDRTLSIIEKYQSNIDQVCSQSDRGLYDAMNKGLSLSTGTFVIFMNSGDTFYNEETLKDLIEAGYKDDFIYGRPLVIEQNGAESDWHKDVPDENSMKPESFLKGMVVCHQALVVRTSIAPNFDLRYPVASDIDWAIKALKASNSVHFHPVYVCRFHRGGLSDKLRRKALLERFHIMRRHFGLVRAFTAHLEILIHRLKDKLLTNSFILSTILLKVF
ncbi:MAG: glycosyltransferase [Saprospiraceae bacterium]|nr:glycosyltransferase [Saprospiraceae bacterium]